MEPKLLYVQSTNNNQKILLQSQYLSKDEYFVVPINETQTVEAIIRSLCFQYFQNSLPQLAQKIKQFAFKSLNLTFSLTLLRDIFVLLNQQHQGLKKFKQYFIQMNRQLSEQNDDEEELLLDLQHSQQQDKDYLFQLAQKGQIRATRLMEQLDLCDQINEECLHFMPAKTVTANTQQTGQNALNPQQSKQQQKLGHANNLLSFFYSAQDNTGREWWKKQNKISEQSKEISRFDRKGGKVMNQKSITKMMIAQMKRDLNRQIELGKEVFKHQQEGMPKFNKMVKGKIAQAKMKAKKKRK